MSFFIMKTAFIFGTRPEIIKLSPIIKLFESRGINFFIIHSGQHKDYNMNRIFIDQLKIPKPKYYLLREKNTSFIKKTVKSIKGGGLIPQDLVNLGRDFSYNFKSAYNALNGYKSPVDPAPYKGQLTGALNHNKFLF